MTALSTWLIATDNSLVDLRYEALMTNKRVTQYSSCCFPNNMLGMLCGFYYTLLIVTICNVVCLPSVFVLMIRYFIMHSVIFIIYSVNIKICSRGLSSCHIFLDIDLHIWVEETNLKFIDCFSFSRNTMLSDFSIKSPSKLFINFLYCIMFSIDTSTFISSANLYRTNILQVC